METIRKQLFALADEDYKRFQCALMPTVDPDAVIGVRTPALRRTATALTACERETVMRSLPHTYYEENNLHAFLIEQIADFDDCVRELDRFLPYVDNWATCDMMRPRVFKTHKAALFAKCEEWLASSHAFTVRYGLEMLMLHGLDEAFDPSFLERAAAVACEDYYVRMMVAWFFATALGKRYDEAVVYLQQRRLDPWVHQKTIQKAVESRLIRADRKVYLKTLKR